MEIANYISLTLFFFPIFSYPRQVLFTSWHLYVYHISRSHLAVFKQKTLLHQRKITLLAILLVTFLGWWCSRDPLNGWWPVTSQPSGESKRSRRKNHLASKFSKNNQNKKNKTINKFALWWKPPRKPFGQRRSPLKLLQKGPLNQPTPTAGAELPPYLRLEVFAPFFAPQAGGASKAPQVGYNPLPC